jgi:xylulokinase
MTRREVVLAIDLGTGGPKVAVVDETGRTLAWSARPVHTTMLPPDGAEQDPHAMWEAVVDAARATLASWGGDVAALRAVAVTSQFMSTVPVAADGTPVGPCIMWMDGRGGADNLALLNDRSFPLWIDRHGLIPLPSGTDGLGHIAVLRREHPDAYDNAAFFVEPMDYVNARLTGRVCATQNTAFPFATVDNRTWGAVEHDPDLVAAAGVDPTRLPPLVPLTGFIGQVTRTAAEQLGLAAGTPVTTGTIDSVTSAVGSGALTERDGSIMIGTTAVMVSHIETKRGDVGSGLIGLPSPVPERYFVMAENGLGGRALEWFLRSVVYPDDAFATTSAGALPEDAYSRAESAAASVAPGSDGALFLPWLLGSIAPAPSDDARAAFAGLGLQHSRAHLARAVFEGVALNLAWLLPHMEAFIGNRLPFVRFGGGGAQSDLWAQILADALCVPVHQLDDPRTMNARGAAFLAFAELGNLTLDDVPSLLQVRAVRDPDPAAVPAMADALARLSALHPHHAALSAVTAPTESRSLT